MEGLCPDKFYGESTQNGKQERVKAGYHYGGGALPFALRLPILRVSGQSLRTSVHGRYARTQEKWQVLAYRGVLSSGGMVSYIILSIAKNRTCAFLSEVI